MSASLNYLIWIILRVQLLILDRVAICKWVFEYPKSPILSGVGMEPFLDSRDFESGFGSRLIGFWTFRSRTRSIYVPTRTGQLHSLIKITYIGLKGLIIKKKKKGLKGLHSDLQRVYLASIIYHLIAPLGY